MTTLQSRTDQFALTGLDGTNPLGFLAAVGTLVTLHDAGEGSARLGWRRGVTWTPVIEGTSVADADTLSEIVAHGLRGRDVPQDAEEQRAAAMERVNSAKKALGRKEKEIRGRGLKGNARKEAIATEVDPLRTEYNRLRKVWLEALASAVPRAELALGKRIDCTSDEYRHHAATILGDAGLPDRSSINLLAAFGTDACVSPKGETIAPTWFQFITGSGHQFFLKTVRDLMGEVRPDRVNDTLFKPWSYPDEGLSMRWDPAEDRRYALMDRDPTASDNKPRTMWMANLLGYRALELFTTAPRRRGPAVVGWSGVQGETTFTWPLWEFAVPPDVVRSLLTLPDLKADDSSVPGRGGRRRGPDRATLRARGISAVFRARRVKVGSGANFKLNFSPGRAIA
jgi:hypothetical protein